MSDAAATPIAWVILVSKPGLYRTEAGGALIPAETWDYVYCGRHLATFVLATLHGEARIRVIDETGDGSVNDMPIRFLEKFRDREAAFKALQVLVGKRDGDAQLLARTSLPAA